MSTGTLVSAICPTYGRFPEFGHLVNECVYWFTRQTYPHKELVILNDCEYQQLWTTVPGVRIVNTKDRAPTLGEKFNRLVELARGTFILPWEDDDISLPDRMSQAVRMLTGRSLPWEPFVDYGGGSFYFNPQSSWYEQSGELISKHTHGVCHNASAFFKDFWKEVGGYPLTSGTQDADMDTRMKTFMMGRKFPLKSLKNPEQWTYVYRWGVSDIHLSGTSDYARSYAENRRGKPGTYRVEAVMRKDYETLCREALKS
jgi:hypothetical protein